MAVRRNKNQVLIFLKQHKPGTVVVGEGKREINTNGPAFGSAICQEHA